MPNILKQQGTLLSDKTVKIPDVDFSPEISLSQPETEESDRTAAQDGEDAEDEGESTVEEPAAYAPRSYTPELMSREELSAFYKDELDEIRTEAQQKAYTDALRQKRAELNEAIERVDNQLAFMQDKQEQYMQRYAQELKFMAIDIAEKLIAEKMTENDMLLSKLVLHMLTSVKNASWISVELSEQMVSLVEAIRKELEKPEYHGRAYVTPIPAARDTCRVATEDGTVVGTVSVQAENLREAFKKLDNEKM